MQWSEARHLKEQAELFASHPLKLDLVVVVSQMYGSSTDMHGQTMFMINHLLRLESQASGNPLIEFQSCNNTKLWRPTAVMERVVQYLKPSRKLTGLPDGVSLFRGVDGVSDDRPSSLLYLPDEECKRYLGDYTWSREAKLNPLIVRSEPALVGNGLLRIYPPSDGYANFFDFDIEDLPAELAGLRRPSTWREAMGCLMVFSVASLQLSTTNHVDAPTAFAFIGTRRELFLKEMLDDGASKSFKNFMDSMFLGYRGYLFSFLI